MSRKVVQEEMVPEAAALAQAWNQGEVRCPECRKAVSLNGLRTLELQNCPHCGQAFFVPKKIGRYYLYEPCGGGGMGSVYKAVSVEEPSAVLAVKVLSREMRKDPGNIYALMNEARMSAHFADSEFIAACIDHGFEDDEYFVVMRYVPGERLDKMLDRMGKIPEKMAMTIALHILAAEQHIYRKGFLYRDLKPENILITPYGYAVLIDFGLCITREQGKTCLDEFVSGSPYYLPPERLLGTGEDASGEIYSLGMVLYQALTGKTYFNAEEIEGLARRHVSNLRVSNTSKMQGMRSSIGIMLESMIRKKPEDRPQTFAYVADSVKAILQEIG